MQVTAQANAGEFYVSLSGVSERYRPATHDDPAEGGLSDAEVTGLYVEVLDRPSRITDAGEYVLATWKLVDVLAGLDKRSAGIVLSNLQRALGDQGVHDILENALEHEAA